MKKNNTKRNFDKFTKRSVHKRRGKEKIKNELEKIAKESADLILNQLKAGKSTQEILEYLTAGTQQRFLGPDICGNVIFLFKGIGAQQQAGDADGGKQGKYCPPGPQRAETGVF